MKIRGNNLGFLTEHWWGICNSARTQCVTIAAFDRQIEKAAAKRFSSTHTSNGGYIAPIGYFDMYPSFSKSFNIYVFPYRYDAVVAGKTVRSHIYDLAGIENALHYRHLQQLPQSSRGCKR
jgi:hypothetical protein